MLTVIFSIIGSSSCSTNRTCCGNIAPSAIGNTFTPNIYAYNLAFEGQEINYAAAIAFLTGTSSIMALSYVVQLWNQRQEKRS